MLPHSLPAPLAQALSDRGYKELTPVQSAVAAPNAQGRDLLVSARTGSGKTVAFGIGIAPTLLNGEARFGFADKPLALVIAPTRELAMQVQRELEWLYAPAGGRVVALVGGMDPRRERRQLEAGCHIAVGTPGRLRDHVERKALDLSGITAVVLDEADEMLDMGFKEDLTFLLSSAPQERRTLLFSATLPKAIVALAQDFQQDAFRIAATGGESGHADITYIGMQVGPRDSEKAVVNVLREKDAEAAIIFCRTRESVKRLHAHLLERGFTAVCLSGELTQGERNHALQALRDGRAKVCVATDVAARGIDLPHLSLVIHADLPTNAEVLQHRSGRTGRAGRKGESVMLVPPSRRRLAERLLNEARIKLSWAYPPDAETIRAKDRERFIKDPLITDEITDDDNAMGALLLKERSPQDIAAILARIYRARLPEPEDLSPQAEFSSPDRKRGERFTSDERFERRERPQHQTSGRDSRRDDIGQDGSRSGAVLFRLDIGRKHRADPKWLLPMLCRRGGVSRQDIGAIRIFDTTTEFEVATKAATAFERNASRSDDDEVTVTRADAPPAFREKAHRKERKHPEPPAAEPRHGEARGASQDQRPGTPPKGRFKPGGGAKGHARSGFQHRKGGKGRKPE